MNDKETLKWLDSVESQDTAGGFVWKVITILRIIIKVLRDKNLLKD